MLGAVRTVPELLWLAIGVIGVLLLTAYPQARRAMTEAAEHTADVVAPAARTLKGLFLGAINAITPIELVGLTLVLVGAVALLYRIRWRLLHAQSLTEISCPRCGSEIHRVHRHAVDRLVDCYVPVRRYRCWNNECRWQGLRVRNPSSPRPAPSHAEE